MSGLNLNDHVIVLSSYNEYMTSKINHYKNVSNPINKILININDNKRIVDIINEYKSNNNLDRFVKAYIQSFLYLFFKYHYDPHIIEENNEYKFIVRETLENKDYGLLSQICIEQIIKIEYINYITLNMYIPRIVKYFINNSTSIKSQYVDIINNIDRMTNDLIQMANNFQYTQCPRCKRLIEKNGGCNDMHCLCGYSFIFHTEITNVKDLRVQIPQIPTIIGTYNNNIQLACQASLDEEVKINFKNINYYKDKVKLCFYVINCPVCMEQTNNNLIYACKHAICRSCFELGIKNKVLSPKCPVCNIDI